MLRAVIGVGSGLIVLVIGLVAVMGLLRSEPPVGPVQPQSETGVISSDDSSAGIQTVLQLPGVPEHVSRVLEWSGDASIATTDELAQIPPHVAAVLTAYGVPLRVPVSGAGK